jgi:hypothetical protein
LDARLWMAAEIMDLTARSSVIIPSFLIAGALVLCAVQAAGTSPNTDRESLAAKTQATDRGPATEQKQAKEQRATADQKQVQDHDRWRYTFHNGEWWCWLPEGRWVYWRGDRWNDYHAKSYAPPASALTASNSSGVAGSAPAANGGENRPFYGHALSNLDRRPLEANNEVGPFYGHALPREVFGPWRSRRANRPFYGHAISSSGD